jgi:hypothetical protein
MRWVSPERCSETARNAYAARQVKAEAAKKAHTPTVGKEAKPNETD